MYAIGTDSGYVSKENSSQDCQDSEEARTQRVIDELRKMGIIPNVDTTVKEVYIYI